MKTKGPKVVQVEARVRDSFNAEYRLTPLQNREIMGIAGLTPIEDTDLKNPVG